jgi:preprotein translocase subunit SecE
MSDIVLYIKESYNELLHNVTWPTWNDLLRNSWIVIVATIIIALIVFIMDFIAKGITTFIYGLGL